MSTDRDYVVIGRSHRWATGWAILAAAHAGQGTSTLIEHHFGMPITRADIVSLRDALDQLLADHPPPDLTWRRETQARPELEPVDALRADTSLNLRCVLADALALNPSLRDVIAVGGGMFGDWVNDGKIPDIAPTKLATLSVGAWQAWRAARSRSEA
jgi:hypothetical protein